MIWGNSKRLKGMREIEEIIYLREEKKRLKFVKKFRMLVKRNWEWWNEGNRENWLIKRSKLKNKYKVEERYILLGLRKLNEDK